MLNRRRFLANAATASVAAAFVSNTSTIAAAAEDKKSGAWRTFEVTTKVDLTDVSGPAKLWLPVVQTAGDYQRAETPRWTSDSNSIEMKKDAASGADILAVEWAGDGQRTIEFVQTVATRNRTADGVAVQQAELDAALVGTPSAPIDGIVKETAMKIVGDRRTDEEKARAIFAWVVENTFRDANIAGCGVGNVKDMLETGYFGGKCADINSLFTALARAAGLPARDVFGIRVADSADFKTLGRSGDITSAQHCRAEVYLEGQGWVPVDPADVRKVVLEEKLPLDNPAVQAFRDKAFGNWEMNWVGFNTARELVLPGNSIQQNFFMYPAAFTSRGEVDCLSPKTFAYSISSREITA
jgi:transglutaminase-like putative cysteine protease